MAVIWNGLAPTASEHHRRRIGPHQFARRAGGPACAHPYSTLLVQDRVQLCRLGPTLLRPRERTAARPALACRHRQRSRLRDLSRRPAAGLGQNQALCALLFLCREVLELDVDDLSATVRAKRGSRLPTGLSVPETAAL